MYLDTVYTQLLYVLYSSTILSTLSHFILTPLHFIEIYRIFYSTTFIWELQLLVISSKIKILQTKHMVRS